MTSLRRFALAVLVICVAASAALAQPTLAIASPVANLHKSPSADSDVVSQAIFGSAAEPLARKLRWVKVRTADGYEGWVRRADLQRVESPYARSGRVARVESLFASLYREPDIEKHEPVMTVPYDAHLEITDERETPNDGRFYAVRLPGRATVWVQSGDVSFDADRLSVDQTIALARRFIGLPYRWGGTSSYGFDCSGFTQMLMRRRGVLVPRDTRPQARWDGLVPVERDVLQPGDLLFFGRTKDRINHTGMYIGNGEFIHATRRGRPMVQIGRLDDEPWTNEYITARRAK